MTNRDMVIAAIEHDSPGYTPHNVFFTGDMLNKMIRHTGNADYINTINNHIDKVSLKKAHVPVEGRSEHFIDEYGVIWDKSGVDKDMGAVAEYQISSVEQLAAYEPPPVDEAYMHNLCKELMAAKTENFAVASVGFTVFERAWSLCGMENLLCYMLTDPDAVESLFAKLERQSIQKVNIALQYDFDGVIFGDDWGQQQGMIMGKPLWRKLLKPHVAAMYGAVKAKGKYVMQHSCGDLKGILDDLIEIGLDVYQTFQPEIYDIREYKEKLRSRLTVWGAISTQIHLPFKTPDEIYDITKNTMQILGKGGGYIASPTHDVPGDVPPENIEAMVKAFKDQYKY